MNILICCSNPWTTRSLATLDRIRDFANAKRQAASSLDSTARTTAADFGVIINLGIKIN